MTVEDPCPACNDTGWAPCEYCGSTGECERCEGSGYDPDADPDGIRDDEHGDECEACGGNGGCPYCGDLCRACGPV